MSYFRELPNIQFNNRTKNKVSNDEVIIIKNLFKRAKIREDFSQVATAFEYYSITEDERPDQIAEKFYGDSELDWVILLTNNIINLQDQWPLNLDSFYKYMIDKYGSEESFNDIHHYETISIYDGYNREVLPGGLKVDKAFYDAPEYQSLDEIPPGITFPPITIPGTQSVLLPVIGIGFSIASVFIAEPGLGYYTKPQVFLSAPPVTSDASVNCIISNFRVSSFVGLISGQGYNNNPIVTFENPPISTQATAICGLGSNSSFSRVSEILSIEGGVGYGLTAPNVEFEFPPNVFAEGFYVSNSSILTGDGLEGMYVRSDGLKVYTSSLFSGDRIREFNLTIPWNISTLVQVNGLNVSSDFSYTTGVEFSPDGIYMYVSGGQSGSYKIVTYFLSTAWNLLSATKIYELSTNSPGGVRLKSDGTKIYILDLSTPDIIKQYDLSTPWDLSTRSGSITGQLDVNTITGDNNLLGFSFFENGSKLFALGSDVQSIFEFDLSTPWDISTATYKLSYFVGDKISQPCDVYVDSKRQKAFIAGNSPTNLNRIHQYEITSVATGSASISNSSVSNITITNPGFGYTEAPVITISAPYPQVTATGIASITAGIVTSLTITNSGFGYTQSPKVTIESAPISRQAVFKYSMNNNSGIATVQIIDGGQNYVNFPFFYVDPPSDLINVEVGDTYSQNNKTCKWSGTEWQEKITEGLQYFDPTINTILKVEGKNCSRPVSNYEYESKLNENKRQILILRPEYLSVVITDLKNSMRYNRESTDYISDTLKGTYNPKLSGV
jgi:hypothetical protein